MLAPLGNCQLCLSSFKPPSSANAGHTTMENYVLYLGALTYNIIHLCTYSSYGEIIEKI